MADVFVSYAREDLERVRPIVGAIEDAGYSVFWDRRIPSGMTWRQYIGKALNEAKCVIVIWSKHSIESDWVMEEADEGRQRKILIPITIEDVIPPLGFRSIQHEDFSQWDGDAEHGRVGSLLKSIEGITKTPPPGKASLDTTQEGEEIDNYTRADAESDENELLTRLRTQMLRTKSPVELSRVSYELDRHLDRFPHSPEARLLKDQIDLALDHAKTRPMASKRMGSRAWFAVGFILLLIVLAVAWWWFRNPHDLVDKPSGAIDRKAPDLPQSFTNGLGMEFVLVPPGNFMMGSDEKPEEKPVHQVFIQKPFYMQTTEVTQGQWKKIMGENPSHFSGCGDDCPVEKVSWKEANMFIRIANEQTGEQYRLPTEAEWEYAARSGGLKQTYAGGEKIDELGWFSLNSGGRTHPAGQKKPNALGIYDMSGSVSEWVEDDWHGNYNGAPTDGSAWIENPRGASRAVRGGSFGADAEYCRTSARIYQERVIRGGALGFRLAKSVNP